MPTTYTPVPGNAPATYTLPSDLDDADAESVNLTFRAAIDNLMGLTALLGQPNTFTAGPLEVDVNDSTVAALVTRKSCDDDIVSGNKWKAVLGFKLGGGGDSYVNVYTGKIGGDQQLAIVLNAVWNTTPQNWSKDNNAADSIALLMSISGSVQISRKAAGVGTWTTWPTNDGVVNANAFEGASVTATAAVSAATGFFTPGTSGDYNYSPVKLRQPMPVPMAGGQGGFNGAGERVAGAAPYIPFPIRFPEGCGGGTVEVMFSQATSSPGLFRISKYTADWTSPGAITETTVDSAATPSVAAFGVVTLSVSSVTTGAEYRLVWTPGNAVDAVEAIRVTTLLDNGPRNTF